MLRVMIKLTIIATIIKNNKGNDRDYYNHNDNRYKNNSNDNQSNNNKKRIK